MSGETIPPGSSFSFRLHPDEGINTLAVPYDDDGVPVDVGELRRRLTERYGTRLIEESLQIIPPLVDQEEAIMQERMNFLVTRYATMLDVESQSGGIQPTNEHAVGVTYDFGSSMAIVDAHTENGQHHIYVANTYAVNLGEWFAANLFYKKLPEEDASVILLFDAYHRPIVLRVSQDQAQEYAIDAAKRMHLSLPKLKAMCAAFPKAYNDKYERLKFPKITLAQLPVVQALADVSSASPAA